MVNEMEENSHDRPNHSVAEASVCTVASRKEKRKARKKEKRKKKRKELAEFSLREEEARLNDPEELLRLQTEEEQERLRVEKERKEFEERERKIIEEWEGRKAQEREEEERRLRAEEEAEQSKQNQIGCADGEDEDGWEYVEDGPPEIIWQGNEIIVKKKTIRVKKKDAGQPSKDEDPNRPTSNPLPPQSENFPNYKSSSILSAQELLENFAQETPNFGTEQDKSHCPFHLKTGACRFGSRCSRIHFYPDKSCTLLIKNMYNGPGLAWEQDEGLEYTDEEVERAYEEFYEDVHTEFLKFGEIVNFKVCRNGSSHLRGNVYVHYMSLDSAVMAYQSVNGRFYAGKQAQCEFVGITKWKVAICGEFMKSKLRTCSRGTACNFVHCFRNPGGDYEWADWDKPPPKYWLNKMAALFGDEYGHGKLIERGSPRLSRRSSRISVDSAYRYNSRRSQSREIRYSRKYEDSSREHYRASADGKQLEVLDEDASSGSDSDKSSRNYLWSHKNRKFDSRTIKSYEMSLHSSNRESESDDLDQHTHKRHKGNKHERHHGPDMIRKGRQQNSGSVSLDDHYDARGSEESGSAYVHEEKSSCHSFDDKRSKRQSAHKRKHSSTQDDSEDEHDKNPSSRGRSYRSSDSSKRYCMKDMGEVGRSRLKEHGLKKSKISDSIDEGIEKRGRWAPNDYYR